MAIKEENTRMTITLSKELDSKIDKLAGLQNISKNAVAVNLIQMSIDAQIQLWGLMKDPEMIKKLITLSEKYGNPEGTKSIEDINNLLNSDENDSKEKIGIIDKLYEDIK